MSYTVLARRYRPQLFEDMTGQEHIVQTLANAIKQDRVAHAFLFCGPRGVGKTTAARLLARALTCEKGPSAEPCGVCRACTEIRDGISIDVVEIDGASNNGVENVREIRDSAKFMPQKERYKIYIIDEVHMLTGAAFNALLKTLEEPPPHVKFILATTEPQKLPDTIVSRCQRHNFRRISNSAMAKRLKDICVQEKLTLSDSALSMIVRQSEGGMRDALSLVDQIVSACGMSPTDEAVSEAMGTIDRNIVFALAEGLLQRKPELLIQTTEEAWSRGIDLKSLLEELAYFLRNVFVMQSTKTTPDDLAETDAKKIRELAGPASPAQVVRLFDVIHGSIFEVSRSGQPKLAFEMVLLKAAALAPSSTIPELMARVEQLLAGSPSPSAGVPGGRSAPSNFPA